MKKSLTIAICFAIFVLTACQSTTQAPKPTSTPTITPTSTIMPIVFLKGTLKFSGARQDPFSTKIAIHDINNFETTWSVQSDKNGEYSFADIEPGKYNLWILMADNKKEMISGCTNVMAPGITWKTVITLSETARLTMETPFSLLQAINADNLADVTSIEFQSPEIELTSGNIVELNVELKCEE
jgi:hypothetical protein